MTTLAQEWMKQGIQQGIQQGVQQTLLESIKAGLELKFGNDGLRLYATIKQTVDSSALRTLLVALFKANSLAELQPIFENLSPKADSNHDIQSN